MDWTTVYAKTAKGVMELTGKSKRLSRDFMRVLQLVDGKVSAAEMLTLSGKISEIKLNQALDSLHAEGYVKILMSGRHSQFAEDLGFPATIGVSEVNTQAFLDAQAALGDATQEVANKLAWNQELTNLKQELDQELQREADKIARSAAQTRLKEEADKQASAVAAKIKAEEAEKFKKAQLAAELKVQEDIKAKIILTEKLREEAANKARADADALAKREAASRAKAEEIEKLRVEAESLARAATETQERLAAQAKKEAEEKRMAEALVEAAETARKLEVEARLKVEAEMNAREAAIAQAEAEQQAYEALQEIENEKKRSEERLRKRLEARAKEEADAKARAEAAERARLEEIERAKAEEVALIIAEAESKRRAEAEARAQEKAAAQAKADAVAREKAEAQAKAEAAAREKVEAQAKAEAEAQAKIAAQARAEAEKVAQAAAQEQARLDVERKLREAAEMQAHVAAEALAREAAEKEAQAEAAALARQQAEERARLEETARIKVEAQAKIKEAEEVVARAKAEAEALARLEAEQKSRELTAARARAEAQAKAEAEAEEEERRQAEIRAIALAEIKARENERHAKLIKPFKPKSKPVKWVKPLMYSLLGLLVIAVALLHVITLNMYLPDVEKMASDQLHEPVSIHTLRGSLWPAPHLQMEGVAIGSAQDVKIDIVQVTPDLVSLFGATKKIRVEGESVTLAQDALPGISGWLGNMQPGALQVSKVVLNRINLAVKDMQLPAFDAVINLAEQGKLKHAVVQSTDKKMTATITAQDEDLQIDITGKNWLLPVGPELMFDEVRGKAVATRHALRFSEFEGRFYGGHVKGAMTLDWLAQWNLTGKLDVSGVELKDSAALFSKNISLDGLLDAKVAYVLQSSTPGQLFNMPRIQATFNIVNGRLGNLDLVRAIQSTTASEINGGQTRFDKLSGVLSLAANRYQLKQMVMAAGLLNASGYADVSQDDLISGRISAELGARAVINRAKINISGRVSQPVLHKGN